MAAGGRVTTSGNNISTIKITHICPNQSRVTHRKFLSRPQRRKSVSSYYVLLLGYFCFSFHTTQTRKYTRNHYQIYDIAVYVNNTKVISCELCWMPLEMLLGNAVA